MKSKLHLHPICIAYCLSMDFITPHAHTYHKFRVSFGQSISDKLLSLQFCHNLLYVLWFTAAGGRVVRVSEENVNVTAGGGTCEGGANARNIVAGLEHTSCVAQHSARRAYQLRDTCILLLIKRLGFWTMIINKSSVIKTCLLVTHC